MTERVPEANVESFFINRWSPRSFDPNFALSSIEVETLIEAARWSPSCFNEQPWRFLIAHRGDPNYEKFLNLLVSANQAWAKDASVIGFIVGKRNFRKKDGENYHSDFDCGAAWMSFTLQAYRKGLHTHGMGGVKYEQAYETLKVPKDEYKIICGFALGQVATAERLPDDLEKQELNHSGRLSPKEIFTFGDFESLNKGGD